MVLRTLNLEKGKRFIIGLMAAILAFSGVGIINTPNSEATVVHADTASMQTVADNLNGKTGISCWVASARVLEADDRLYFADDFTATDLPIQATQTVSNGSIRTRSGSQLELQVGDIIAFYDGSETSDRMPAHTITYIGAHGSHTGNNVWLSGGRGSNGAVAYTGPTWGSTPTNVKLLRFRKTNTVSVPWTITTSGDSAGHLTLTPNTPETSVNFTNHPAKNDVKYNIAGSDKYANHVPKTNYTNASFSRDNNATKAIITVTGTAAYFGDTYEFGTDMPYRFPIVAKQEIAHGDQSDAVFRENIINSVKYIVDNYSQYVKAGVAGDNRYVNQNIRITGVNIEYHTVAGSQNSSDYNKTVKTIVYPISATGTPGTPTTKETEYAVGEQVVEPQLATNHYFDGWYKATTADHKKGESPKSNIITKDMTGDDLTFYGFDRIDDNATLNITVNVKSKVDGNEEPLADVKLGLYKAGGTEPVAEAITHATGTVTFSGVKRGSYEVRETDIPTEDASGNPVNYGYLKQTSILNQ